MSTEPLWRGPLGEIFEPKHIALLRESPGTEVEVWPAGDRPTREQILAVASENLLDQRWANKCTDELMALLHGQGDEIDEDAT